MTTLYVSPQYEMMPAETTSYVFAGGMKVAKVVAKTNSPTDTASEIASNAQTISYYLSDHLGGLDAVLDDRGNVIERADYLPFGQDRVRTDPPVEKYGFTGKELDGESGLYYYGARYYDPMTGRFLSPDPLSGGFQNPQSLNKYSYALNNPLKYVDPTGMFNVDTGEIEEGDKTSTITEAINKKWETNYDWEQIRNLNSNIFNKNSIALADLVGQILIPNSNVPDITKELTGLMHTYASDPGIANPFYFRDKLDDGGEWDLKSQPGTFCIQDQCGGKKYENYVFSGDKVDFSAPGNILYGYVGMSDYVWWLPLASLTYGRIDSNPTTLLFFAGKNQETKSGVPHDPGCFNDDCVDQENIKKGMLTQLKGE